MQTDQVRSRRSVTVQKHHRALDGGARRSGRLHDRRVERTELHVFHAQGIAAGAGLSKIYGTCARRLFMCGELG